MNGNSVHEWGSRGGIMRAKLLEDGRLLTVETEKDEKNHIRKYTWNGDLDWDYKPFLGTPHHDAHEKENGNILAICREAMPEEYRKKIRDPVRRSANPIWSDLIIEISPEKEVVWEWHAYKHLDVNRGMRGRNQDWTHMNTVRPLPENKWFDSGDDRFKPGNILLSPRNLSFIFIADRESKKIVWEYHGRYAGGLAGQHEPNMIKKGYPGEGNIIVFDNGAPPYRSEEHTGQSIIREIDPITKKLVWKYEKRGFYSPYVSSVTRLPNGNTLIGEGRANRRFEVTPEKNIVWEHVGAKIPSSGRVYRYSQDYCPQFEELKEPKGEEIHPPSHAETNPEEGGGWCSAPIYYPENEPETNTQVFEIRDLQQLFPDKNELN